jgi:hypothetical protein|tara:strand:+ start:1602 stop:1829 length:228 start_codon:yes stop_codon:yes gene_type:complete
MAINNHHHKLQKRHFIGIADSVAEMNLSKESHTEVIKQLILYLCTTNHKFNKQRFRDYINSKIKEKQKLLRIQTN